MDDCVEFVFLFWACLKVGIIPILINNKFSCNTVIQCIDSVDIKTIITKQEKKANEFLKANGFFQLAKDDSIIYWKREKNNYKKELINKDIAFGIFTSGSTGIPRCVLHTHDGIIKCVELYYKRTLSIRSDDIIYSASKMMHTYGLGNTVFQTVGVRASSIVCPDGTSYSVIRNIQKFKPTVLFAVPTVYREILDIGKSQEVDLSSVRLCFSAGEHLSAKLYYEFYERFNCSILNGMGNTEYLTTFISNTEKENMLGSCGKCISGFSAKVIDFEDNEVKVGKIGRLFIKGDIHLLGYYGDKKEYTSGDYFNTQNLCYKNDAGFIWLVGRENDLFKVKGRWVNPYEIEDLLEKMKEIEESLVVVDTSSGVNKSILYIKIKNEFENNLNKKELFHRLRVFIKKNLEHYKCPAKIIVVKTIPKGATGKKKRQIIMESKISVKE